MSMETIPSPPSSGIGLHACCAPCLLRAREAFRNAGARGIAGIFFHNPNIHPLLEFRRRVKALKIYLERYPLFSEIDETYGLERYLAAVRPGGTVTGRRERCYRCCHLRLDSVAKRCAELGLDGFTTTLLASREQDLDVVRAAGRDLAAEHGVEFVDGDYRHFEPAARDLRGIYRQQYCGCVFSEDERYRGTGRHLYPPTRGEDDATSLAKD